jgi:hypothetical protein
MAANVEGEREEILEHPEEEKEVSWALIGRPQTFEMDEDRERGPARGELPHLLAKAGSGRAGDC